MYLRGLPVLALVFLFCSPVVAAPDWELRQEPTSANKTSPSKKSGPSLSEALAIAKARSQGEGQRPSLARAISLAKVLQQANHDDLAAELLHDVLFDAASPTKLRTEALDMLAASLAAMGKLGQFVSKTEHIYNNKVQTEEWRILANVYLSLGDRQNATTVLQKLVDQSPKDKKALDILQSLKPTQPPKETRPLRRPSPRQSPGTVISTSQKTKGRSLNEAVRQAQQRANRLGRDHLGISWPYLLAMGDTAYIQRQIASARFEETRLAATMLLHLVSGEDAAASRALDQGIQAAMATGQPDEFAVFLFLHHAPGRITDNRLADLVRLGMTRAHTPQTSTAILAALESPHPGTAFFRLMLDGTIPLLEKDKDDPQDLHLRIFLLAAQRLPTSQLQHPRLESILQIGMHSSNPLLRQDVARLCVRLYNTKGGYMVMKSLTQTQETLSDIEISILASAGVPELLDLLRTGYNRLSPGQKRLAIQAAWALGGPKASALLSVAARDPRSKTLAPLALIGLGYIADPSAIPLLRDIKNRSPIALSTAASLGLALMPTPDPLDPPTLPPHCASRNPGIMLLTAIHTPGITEDLLRCIYSPLLVGNSLNTALLAASNPKKWQQNARQALTSLVDFTQIPPPPLTQKGITDTLSQVSQDTPLFLDPKQLITIMQQIADSKDTARLIRMQTDLAGLARPAGYGMLSLLSQGLHQQICQHFAQQ